MEHGEKKNTLVKLSKCVQGVSQLDQTKLSLVVYGIELYFQSEQRMTSFYIICLSYVELSVVFDI